MVAHMRSDSGLQALGTFNLKSLALESPKPDTEGQG